MSPRQRKQNAFIKMDALLRIFGFDASIRPEFTGDQHEPFDGVVVALNDFHVDLYWYDEDESAPVWQCDICAVETGRVCPQPYSRSTLAAMIWAAWHNGVFTRHEISCMPHEWQPIMAALEEARVISVCRHG